MHSFLKFILFGERSGIQTALELGDFALKGSGPEMTFGNYPENGGNDYHQHNARNDSHGTTLHPKL
jgi:hypothetical protein